MQRYSFKVDGEYRRPTPDDAGAFYDVAIVDARIAELEKLLLEARTFMEDDFPPIPASQLTFEQCCVTPRYFEFWKALHKTLSL